MIEEIAKEVVLEVVKGASEKENSVADVVQQKRYDQLESLSNEAKGVIKSYVPRTKRLFFRKWEELIVAAESKREATFQLIEEKSKNIPEDKLVESEAFIAVPALQQLSYCIDSEELRDLYANLLVSSMNTDTKSKVHPSFTSIIRDLNPDEAKLLKCIENQRWFPLIDLNLDFESGGYKTLLSNFSDIGDDICEYPENISSYLENLNRLQLIDIDSMGYLNNQDIYDKLEKHRVIDHFKAAPIDEGTWSIKKKIAEITNFGKQFIEACVTPEQPQKEGTVT